MTFPTSDEVKVGSILRETYEITALLGYGGMGAVYVARHLRLPGTQVAVKVLHAGSGLSPEIYKRFRREAEIASQLGHPNIVQVRDFDTLATGTPFLVLELLKGESLAQRLRRGPLGYEQTIGIVRQVGSALRAAHRAGVVHRDLKPDNVFLEPSEAGGVVSERVKLLDFGISKINVEGSTLKTQDAVLMGTPLYMSPEQALGKNSEVDPRTDIFALGSIVYETLSGRSPFAGENIPQIIYRIVHEAPAPLASLVPHIPAKAIAAVERALAKPLAARYPEVAGFVTDFTGTALQTLSDSSFPAVSVPAPSTKGSPGAVEEPLDPTFISQNRPRPQSEAPPAPAVTERDSTLAPPPAQRSLVPVFAIGAILIAAVSGGSWYFLKEHGSSHPNGHTQTDPGIQAGATDAGSLAGNVGLPAVDAGPKVIEGPPLDGGVAVVGVLTSPPDAGHPRNVAIGPRHVDHMNTHSNVAPEAAKEAREVLAEAERLLKSGDPSDAKQALVLAQRSERSDPSIQDHSLKTRAYCMLGSLTDAKPEFELSPKAERRTLRNFCKSKGVEFIER